MGIFALLFLHYILLKGFSKWGKVNPKCQFTTGGKKKKQSSSRDKPETNESFLWICLLCVWLCLCFAFSSSFPTTVMKRQKVFENICSNYFEVLWSAPLYQRKKTFQTFLASGFRLFLSLPFAGCALNRSGVKLCCYLSFCINFRGRKSLALLCRVRHFNLGGAEDR